MSMSSDNGTQTPAGGVRHGTRAPAMLSAQQQALLSFKPSSRDVISGIAPHVFEDQRSPYRPRHRRRATSPDCRARPSTPTSTPRRSPLRLSAVTLVDEHQEKVEDIGMYAASPPAPLPLPRTPILVSLPSTTQKTKTKRRTFGMDRVLKTLVLRLK
ncbi:hypothetical protein DFH09DRAFT_298394 [Mycena vulgaris]|nr:hypothetical protein DFH09DRAFT_298394 [Mycena vulgaris]